MAKSELPARLAAFRQRARKLPPERLATARLEVAPLLLNGARHLLYRQDPALSARRQFSHGQLRGLLAAAIVLTVGGFVVPIGTAILLNAAFILFSLAVTILRVLFLVIALRQDRPRSVSPHLRLTDDELPVITILCPLYKEASSLPGLLASLKALDYPAGKLDIKLVLEADDHETIARAQALASKTPVDLVIVPEGAPRTKPKACNYALWSAKGDLLVIYDAEDRPAPTQLRRAAEAFAGLPDDVACLQARLNYYNRDKSWLTRLFAAEYALIFDIVLPGLARIGAPLPLGGTSNIFRTDTLIEAGAWDPYNVTEDADIGLRLGAAGYRSLTLDATTLEEATSTLGAWLRQRTRWIKGYMQSWAVHARHGRKTLGEAITLHFIVGGVVVAALVNPVFWTLYILWVTGAADLGWLFPTPLGALATLSFLAGNLVLVWLYMIAPLRRRWHDLVPWALTSPLYWILQSVAGYRAAWQFLRAPHLWEKTHHEGRTELEDIDPRDLEAAG